MILGGRSLALKRLTRAMPKRKREEAAAGAPAAAASSSSSSSSSDPTSSAAGRPKRAAASEASERIRQSVEADSITEAAAARGSSVKAPSSSSSSSSSSGGVVTIVPGMVPGYTPDPSLCTGKPPTREADGTLKFPGHPEFRPNRTPAEVLNAGSFGGGYFRTIRSGVTGQTYVDAWREFPAEWFAGLNPKTRLARGQYDASVNKYGVSCGQGLDAWESSGWIVAQDPFGWFHWYCRFFLGRRSTDDARQISRWVGVAGPKGRWKQNLIAKCVAAGRPHDDASVSPVVRQTLLHWGYELTKEDYQAFSKTYQQTGRAPYIPAVSVSSSSKKK